MPSPVSSRTRFLSRRRQSAHVLSLGVECLEQRQLLSAAEFELSSLVPANGGDGSNGFVVDGVVAGGRNGQPRFTYEPAGDVNGDGIDDFLLAAPGAANSGGAVPPTASDAYLVFGRPGETTPQFDLGALDGSNGYAIHDAVAGDGIGFVGGGAGDLNHDGRPDLVLGAIYASPSSDRLRAGQTFVLFGGPSNLSALDLADGTQDGQIDLQRLDGSNGFILNGVSAGDASGRAVGAGDVNGDHIDDLIVGGHGSGGRAYVVFGRDSTLGQTFPAALELASLDGSNGFGIPNPQTTSGFGNAAGAGDVNGDGIGDLIIGDYLASPSGRSNAGRAYVIFGRASFPASFDLGSLNGSSGFALNGAAASDLLGYSVDGAGDVNGDGLDDVVIGAVLVSNGGAVRSGAAYVVFGKPSAFSAALEVSTLNGSNGFALFGVAASDSAGGPVAGAGDINGDGLGDLIVGAATADPNGITDAGQSYVLYGRRSFGANLNLSSLLAANGGDGSAGFAINGFLAGQNTRPAAIGDVNGDGFADIRIGAESDDPNGLTDAGRAFIVYGKASPPPVTRFYVVNDGSPDQTYEYDAIGSPVENYTTNSGNTAPRGATSTAAGDKVWVVDVNHHIYVYDNAGALLGSWTAGSLNSRARVEGIATNGTDVWIVDAYQHKVFRYTGAASRLSGSQNAASSFNLDKSNSSPKDVVTDGTYLWVVNDSTTDKVFKYTLSGSLVGSWTISGAGSSPTGITLDPTNPSALWIVDSGTRRVYQFDAATGRTSGSQSPSTSFALTAGNSNPQGIADPPPSAAQGLPGVDGQGSRHAAAPPNPPVASLSPTTASTGTAGANGPSILIPLSPSIEQDLTWLASELISAGARQNRGARQG